MKNAICALLIVGSLNAVWYGNFDNSIADATNALDAVVDGVSNYAGAATNAINANALPNLGGTSNAYVDIPQRMLALSAATFVSGTIFVAYFTAPFTKTYSNIGVLVTTAYADVSAGMTNCMAAIYELSNNNTSLSNLVVTTATNTNWLGVTGYRTNGFTTPFNAVAGTRYAIAVLCYGTSATITQPAVRCSAMVSAMTTLDPVLCRTSTGATVLTSPLEPATTTGTFIWFRLQ